MKITILNIDYHRNGMDGAPYHAVVFRDGGPGSSVKVGIVFEKFGYTAILDVANLAEYDLAFGANSWQGDYFGSPLRRAVRRYQVELNTDLD